MSKLILLRHGQSKWNEQNLFTGWIDIPLSEVGIQEAIEAGKKISHLPIDKVFASALIRSQMTTMIALNYHESRKTPRVIHKEGKMAEWGAIYNEQIEHTTIPVYISWQINERMYGDLQGRNKDETRAKYGAEQVKIWRRSYDIPPPRGESLEMTAQRSIPYFEEEIVPCLERGENIFVCAHGNSLRSIIMKIEDLNKEEVINLELETGKPVVYEFSQGNFIREM